MKFDLLNPQVWQRSYQTILWIISSKCRLLASPIISRLMTSFTGVRVFETENHSSPFNTCSRRIIALFLHLNYSAIGDNNTWQLG